MEDASEVSLAEDLENWAVVFGRRSCVPKLLLETLEGCQRAQAKKVILHNSRVRQLLVVALSPCRNQLALRGGPLYRYLDGGDDDPARMLAFISNLTVKPFVSRAEIGILRNETVESGAVWSRLGSRGEPGGRGEVDLAAIANDVYEAFKARADRAGIELVASIQSGLAPVLGNEDQLRRVLYNLMDNAIKYTARGGRVEIALGPGSRDRTALLKVIDTGFGIAPAHLPHIFERFYRVEATRPRFGPSLGSGLGLPIAKSIAEAHGGQIGVSSKVGQGTTFWVELPTSRVETD